MPSEQDAPCPRTDNAASAFTKDLAFAQSQELFAQRVAEVRHRLERAAGRASRSVDEITLIAVSKFHPAAAIAAAAGSGQRIFGENYVQEALSKQSALAELDLQWHFIGHVQTNKAKDVSGRFALIHTVDSEACAKALDRRFPTGKPASNALDKGGSANTPCRPGNAQDVLIQVNIGGETQKSGVSENELVPLAETIMTLSHVHLCGLMCLPPFFDDGEAARPYFARLRHVRDALEARLGVLLPHLSMGMSGDFEPAVEEGATLVRIGTTLFGDRKKITH